MTRCGYCGRDRGETLIEDVVAGEYFCSVLCAKSADRVDRARARSKLERARLDADGKATPRTEIVAVMPPDVTGELGTVHVGQATHYIVRPREAVEAVAGDVEEVDLGPSRLDAMARECPFCLAQPGEECAGRVLHGSRLRPTDEAAKEMDPLPRLTVEQLAHVELRVALVETIHIAKAALRHDDQRCGVERLGMPEPAWAELKELLGLDEDRSAEDVLDAVRALKPSEELRGCLVVTERSEVLHALRRIARLVPDDSPIDQLVQPTLAMVAYDGERAEADLVRVRSEERAAIVAWLRSPAGHLVAYNSWNEKKIARAACEITHGVCDALADTLTAIADSSTGRG